MTAAINIPPASVCNTVDNSNNNGGDDTQFEGSGLFFDGSGDDYYYYNYIEKCPTGVLNCTVDVDGYEYVYYNLYELFGECSKKLRLSSSKGIS